MNSSRTVRGPGFTVFRDRVRTAGILYTFFLLSVSVSGYIIAVRSRRDDVTHSACFRVCPVDRGDAVPPASMGFSYSHQLPVALEMESMSGEKQRWRVCALASN